MADVHFDYRIAVECVKSGVDKVRINPGNIYQEDEIRQVIRSCRDAGIPIRVGANSGSILTRSDRDHLRAAGKPVEVGIRGEDFGVLEEIAGKFVAALNNTRGVSDIASSYEFGKKQLRVVVDEEKAQKYY